MNFPEASSECGHLANTSLNYFTSLWGWLKPRACPQGAPHLVRSWKRTVTAGSEECMASMARLWVLWTLLGGVPRGVMLQQGREG